MRSFIIAAVAALAFASSAAAHDWTLQAPGVPCGNTCIAKGTVCHVTPAPHCSTGVPCGNTCIAKGKVCHQSS
jgi:hypothetical protein